jgi:hypothetical protein
VQDQLTLLATPLLAPIPGLTPLLGPALPGAGRVVALGGGRLVGAGTALPAAPGPSRLAPRVEGPAAELAVLLVETANEEVGRLGAGAGTALAFLEVGTKPLGFLAPDPAVD